MFDTQPTGKYYNMDSVPPHPELSLQVLVSGKCAADPCSTMVLVGHCHSPSTSHSDGETH
jgi:hypothetical protein